MKKKLLAVMLLAILMLNCVQVNVFAESYNSKITNDELETDILECFKWAQMGNGNLLNAEFLQSVGMTDGDWFPINMGRYGYQEETYDLYLKAIEQDINEKYQKSSKLNRNKATEWHRIALAVTSMGGNPTSIGQDTEGNPINLIADGTYNCVVSSVDRQGINGPVWALIALDSKMYKVPADAKYQREDLIAMILERQMSDGGFTLGGSATNDLPSDPDITAMVLQALAPYQDSSTLYKAHDGILKTVKQVTKESLNQMSRIQQADGDFQSWGTANVESVAQMLVALTALGIDPYEDTRFNKNGNTLIDGILKYQLKSGGFTHSFVADPQNPSALAGEENRMASEQAALGLISYYRFLNGMTRLYDFTDMKEEVEKAVTDVPWIVCGETRISGQKNEKFTTIFDEKVQAYTLKVPLGFSSVKVIETPFDEKVKTNFKIGTTINCNDTNTFYYYNQAREKIDFTINCEFNYYAEPESIILETIYLTNFSADSNTKSIVEEKVKDLESRFENLEFSYEKCYVTAQVDFYKQIQLIKDKLANIKDKVYPDKVEPDKEYTNQVYPNKVETDKNNLDKENTDKNNLDKFAISKDDADKHNAGSGNTGYGGTNGGNGYAKYETTTVTTKAFEGMIPKAEFEAIQGIDENVKGTGEIGDTGRKCTFIFNGLDVVDPMDFIVKINTECKDSDDILKLSPEAFIFNLEHQCNLPGTALLEMETELEDGEYILFKYNDIKKQAEVGEKIEVVDGKTRFLIYTNQTYFIAKESSLESLLNLTPESQNNEISKVNAEITKEQGINCWVILGIVLIILALILGIILAILVRKQKKQQAMDNLSNMEFDQVIREQ